MMLVLVAYIFDVLVCSCVFPWISAQTAVREGFKGGQVILPCTGLASDHDVDWWYNGNVDQVRDKQKMLARRGTTVTINNYTLWKDDISIVNRANLSIQSLTATRDDNQQFYCISPTNNGKRQYTRVIVVDEPCFNHKSILKAEKRNALFRPKDVQTAIQICDRALEPGWYRVQSLHEEDMPTSPPAIGACNTGFPIWLNGELPSQGDLAVDRTACMVGLSDNCSETFNIKVKNCGTFRVYRLVPTTSCPVAYCFGDKILCPPGQSSEDGFPPGCSDDYPKIKLTSTVTAGVQGTAVQQVIFVCDIRESFNTSYHIDILWTINGIDVKLHKGLTAAELRTAATLQEEEWRDNHKLGMTVQCEVRVRYDKNSIPGPRMTSAEFFAGVKVLTPEVDVIEGENIELRFNSTIPITCANGQRSDLCDVRFLASTVKEKDFQDLCKGADGTNVYLENCGFILPAGEHSEATMTMKTKPDSLFGNRLAQVSMMGVKRPAFEHDIWEAVKLPNILVHIQDKDHVMSGKTCYSHNDPHMRTFDGKRYELHLPGEFVLYRHKVLPVQVHTFHQHCSGRSSNIFCNCGVAVQSSLDVFVVDYCEGKGRPFRSARIQKYGCSNNQMCISRTGNTFHVLLTTGTKVTITVDRNSIDTFLNVDIEASLSDLNQTEGLCGKANRNVCDDFIGSDLTNFYFDYNIPFYPNGFSKSWEINGDHLSLFGGKPVNAWALQTIPGQFSCQPSNTAKISAEVFCVVQPIRCNKVDADVTKLFSQRCIQLAGRRRRKRDTQELDLDYDDDEYVFTYEKADNDGAPDWSGNWTEEKARLFCVDFFDKSAIYQACKEVPNMDSRFSLESCMLDIQYTGGTDWALTTLENHKVSCNSEVWKNATLHTRTPDSPSKLSVFELVRELSCPNECTYHGQCVNGSCQCEPEWMGEDCATSVSQPVQVFGTPKNGMCDLSVKPCTATIVYGQNFANTASLKCRVRTIMTSTVQIDHSSVVTEAIFRFDEEVVCRVPFQMSPEPTTNTPQERHGEEFAEINVTGFMISVANNETFSEEVLFLPHDKTCIKCITSGNTPSCLLKRNHCYIEDMCYVEDEVNPDNPCEGCDIYQSNRHWTGRDCEESTPSGAKSPPPVLPGRAYSSNISPAALGTVVFISFLIKKMV